jgi:hypothetical protein
VALALHAIRKWQIKRSLSLLIPVLLFWVLLNLTTPALDIVQTGRVVLFHERYAHCAMDQDSVQKGAVFRVCDIRHDGGNVFSYIVHGDAARLGQPAESWSSDLKKTISVHGLGDALALCDRRIVRLPYDYYYLSLAC